MTVREYSFVVGPETSTLPTVGTPTQESDIVTKGYVDKHYLQGQAAVANITALKVITASSRFDKNVIFVENTTTLYSFDAESSASGDDHFVIVPDIGTGRWLRVTEKFNTQSLFKNLSDPSNPSAGYHYLYAKSDGFYFKNSSGVVGKVGSGGGGSSIVWTAPDGSAPAKTEEHNETVFLFEKDMDQNLIAYIKVPQSYSAGVQIVMYVGIYSSSAANNIHMRSTSYLIRKNTDAIDSTTNSRVSTNTEITNTLAKQYREISLDLTDSNGKINSVSVTAGDVIKVVIDRNETGESSSDTADTRFVPNATEVKFA